MVHALGLLAFFIAFFTALLIVLSFVSAQQRGGRLVQGWFTVLTALLAVALVVGLVGMVSWQA